MVSLQRWLSSLGTGPRRARGRMPRADGGGENRRRSRGRNQSTANKRAPPSQPPRKLRAAYKAGNCKEGTECSASHDVAA
eukprot:7147785-Alexandrium_andersonii.AAC.1